MPYEKSRRATMIPLIHFCLSFLYEGLVLKINLDKMIVAAMPKSDFYSDTAERIMGYCISKLFCFLFIFFLWNLIFYCIRNWKQEAVVRVAVIVFVIGALLVALLYPYPFMRSEDNLITYSYGIRMFPEYWHSAYSSCLFCGLLMVIPHPVFISIFQWMFFVFILGYVCLRMKHSTRINGKGRFFLFLIVLIPDTAILITDAYRTEQYALLCMFALCIFVFDSIDHKQRSTKQLLLLALLCAFLAVWRSEGIVFGLLVYPTVLLFLYKPSPRKGVGLFSLLILCFVLISIPQKLGDSKYYGKDYSFINSFATLSNILNAPTSNLSYDGAEEDLDAISCVTPLDLIQVYGMDGYRRYNVAKGRVDINQSMASEETGKAYMNAYYRLVFHNIPIYAKTQLTMLTKVLGITESVYTEKANASLENDLEPWTYQAWEEGKTDLYESFGTEAWNDTAFHATLIQLYTAVLSFLADIRRLCRLDTVFLILMPLVEIYLFFREAILFFRKKESNLCIAAFCVILLGQAAAIVLFMPAAVTAYLHAYYYMTFLLEGIYLSYLYHKRTMKYSN